MTDEIYVRAAAFFNSVVGSEEEREIADEILFALDALRKIAAQQPETLKMIERNGFVFDSLGAEPGNWQHLAFSIYTDLCEVDLIARHALGLSIGEKP